MSAEVAPQGIAQDYVTLFIAVPLLIAALGWSRGGSIRARLFLTGTIGYLLVTYLFYLVMGMYNALFLLYAFLLCVSFFAFLLAIGSFSLEQLVERFRIQTPTNTLGGFLVCNALAIAALWLSIIVPPLMDGSIIPVQVEHYTTLIVQGLDLGILLPAAAISGILLVRKHPLGYLWASVYFVFLSLLMTALTAKVLAMKMLGQDVIPVIFIIPTFNLIAIICTILVLRNIRDTQSNPKQA
jgi:hypothetical protein